MKDQLKANVKQRRTAWQIIFWALLLMMTSDLARAQNEQQPKVAENLLKAAQKGETNTVQALLAAGGDVNAKDKNGRTALILATKNGHEDTVKVLLSADADIYAKDKNGETALSLAEKNKGKRQAVVAGIIWEHIRLQVEEFRKEILAKGKAQSTEDCELLEIIARSKMTTNLTPGGSGSAFFFHIDVKSGRSVNVEIAVSGVYSYPSKNITVFEKSFINWNGREKRFGKTAIVEGKCYDLPADTKIPRSQ